MLVVVGRIGRPHGVKGAATIDVRTDEPDKRFAVGARLLTDSGLDLTVASATWHSGRLLVTFEGYEDRTAVEQLRNVLVSVDRPADERPEDPEEVPGVWRLRVVPHASRLEEPEQPAEVESRGVLPPFLAPALTPLTASLGIGHRIV